MPRIAIPKANIQLRKKNRSDKTGYLRLVFRWNGNTLTYPLSKYIETKIESKKWDDKKGEPKTTGKTAHEYAEVKKKLNNIKGHIQECQKSNPNILPLF